MTSTPSLRSRWEAIANTMPAGAADGIEQNAEELGFEIDSDEFFAECIGEAQAS